MNSQVHENKILNNNLQTMNIEEKEKLYNNIKNAICKIIINDDKTGYGFFCKICNRDKSNIIPVLITNYTTLSLEYIKTNINLKLLLNEDKETKSIPLNDSRIYYTNEDLDLNITIIGIKPELDEINTFLEIDENILEDNFDKIYKDIYIIERPHFKSDYISICPLQQIRNNIIQYEIKTAFGCIGTPIFNLENNKIIGIHMNEIDSKENKNILFRNIIDAFNNRNEIIICISVINKKPKNNIYFLNDEINWNENDNLDEINESNTLLYINGKEEKFKKYFKPEKKGFYIIKLKFKNDISNCYKLFYNCKDITKIDLSSFNTNNTKNMSYMFANCSNLTNINLSGLNAENVTNISYMFYSNSNLLNLDLSSFKTKSVTNMEKMFSLCINLQKVNLSNFDTQNVNNMSYMFKDCHELKKLDLSSFDTKNVIYINSIFDSCFELQDLKLGKLDTSNVISMEKMFYDCQNLISIDDIKFFDTKNVTNMYGMFYNCKNLKNLDVSSFNTENVVNMCKMFCQCRNLFTINLLNFNTEKVENMCEMFSHCDNLYKLDLSKFNTVNVIYMSEMFSNCKNLLDINISCFNLKNIITMNKMFYNCNSLNSIKVDFSTIKQKINMNNIFSNCYCLQYVDISSFDSLYIKNISLLFDKCISLIAIGVNKNSYLDFKYSMNNNFKLLII